MHIATTETFFIDAPVIKCKCWICGTTCNQELGWIGARCSNCEGIYNLEDCSCDIVRIRRENILKISRRQMAELTGYKTDTIKKFELRRCSKIYFEKSLIQVKKHIKNKRK